MLTSYAVLPQLDLPENPTKADIEAIPLKEQYAYRYRLDRGVIPILCGVCGHCLPGCFGPECQFEYDMTGRDNQFRLASAGEFLTDICEGYAPLQPLLEPQV